MNTGCIFGHFWSVIDVLIIYFSLDLELEPSILFFGNEQTSREYFIFKSKKKKIYKDIIFFRPTLKGVTFTPFDVDKKNNGGKEVNHEKNDSDTYLSKKWS
ncbi:hypothetical protein VIN7_10472 [Saccharomyces cerevisiae x Saccharomyces kudriavzevii VIN7]|uniref:Uncharacterized protein n=1 Tax=Saccharomyces cerevisiae x Saccharomyces kudriavzevii (strain VIN7) TaxID=1095631 RepID=H0H2B6_SACCK|nr:hypothetical protein VIN7_10472 [Saccharomyces cerevisiae x Saccharomyces kudriavzevii VIN7]